MVKNLLSTTAGMVLTIFISLFTVGQTNLLKNGDFEAKGAWKINQWIANSTNPLYIEVTSSAFGYSIDVPDSGAGKCLNIDGAVEANSSWNQIKEVLWQPVLLHKNHSYKVTGAFKMLSDAPTNGGGIWAEIHFYYTAPVPDALPAPGGSMYAFNSWTCGSDVTANGSFQSNACTYGLGASVDRPYYSVPDSIFAFTKDTVTVYFACQFGIATPDANEFNALFDEFQVIDSVDVHSAIKKVVNDGNFSVSISPNPVNLKALISLNVPVNGIVNLKLFNMLGQNVTTLLNEYRNKGTYNVKFDGSKLNSGMYLLKCDLNGVTSTRKLYLLK